MKLLDHLVGAHKDCFGDGDPEGFRSLEVHDQLEPRWALDGEVGALRTTQNPTACGATSGSARSKSAGCERPASKFVYRSPVGAAARWPGGPEVGPVARSELSTGLRSERPSSQKKTLNSGILGQGSGTFIGGTSLLSAAELDQQMSAQCPIRLIANDVTFRDLI